jgi:hypothetical protein
MGTYRLFGGTTGPSTPTPSSGSAVMGLLFQVTTGGSWLNGYWWWVCPSGQDTSAQTFALWLPYPPLEVNNGNLVSGATVTSGTLTPGQWNFIPLPEAVPLAIGTWYLALTGTTGAYPVTGGMFGTGDTYANGVVSGPLQAASDSTTFLSEDNGFGQCPVALNEGADPTKYMPVYSGYPANAYYWLDPQVTTEPPPGSSFRMFPSMPIIGGKGGRATDPPDTTEQSSGTEFWLSDEYAEYSVDKVWFWSPVASASDAGDPAATLLPSSTAIFDISSQEMVAGTQQGSTTGSLTWYQPDGTVASPGDGWVYVPYEGVTLPPGKFKVAMYCYGGGTTQSTEYLFFAELPFYFGADIDTDPATPGPASAAGITNGPLYSPNLANASLAEANGSISTIPAGTLIPSNSTYQTNDSSNTGTFLFPYTFDSKDNGEVRWVDVEVTPVRSSSTQPASSPSPVVAFLL